MSLRTEVLQSCPNCGSENISLWSEGSDLLHQSSQEKFKYSECGKCGLVFQSLRPIESRIADFYPSNYAPYSGETVATEKKKSVLEIGPWKRRFFNKINPIINKIFKDETVQKLELYYKPKKNGMTFLDFGCGSDAFLNKARTLGWETTIGMDFIDQPLVTVKNSGHKAVLYDSEKAWDEIPDGSIDMIRGNHVLEHLYHPHTVLPKLYKKLKPGGVLHFAIPNPSGISAHKFKKNWHGLDCPRHIMLYPPALLKDILKTKTGFSSVEVLFEEITKDYARSIGYQLLERGEIKHEEIEKLMHNQDLVATLLWEAKLAVRMGKADRFHVFAVK